MAKQLIDARTLKGFRDFLPDRMMLRETILETARRVYRSYGFAPIDTPALELFEVLAGKGSEETDRQMYHFKDAGDRHVGMRFDLTIPLARFVSQHAHEIGMPFKRYHMATVWRGEAPQAGRFREFMQCDFDTIGTTSIVSDIETVLVVHDLVAAIGVGEFQIRVNNRKVLTGLLNRLSLKEHSTAILRSIDKLSKIGEEAVIAEIVTATGCKKEVAAEVVNLLSITGSCRDILGQMPMVAGGDPLALEGAHELEQLVAGAIAAGVPETRLAIDLRIARGLDYYTGTILETFLAEHPGIGSICSGGRYDDLTQMFSKNPMPGIGASLGLDRLIAAMEELGLAPKEQSPVDVMIVQFDPGLIAGYLRMASMLRAAGLAVELFPEARKVGQQFKYASKKGIPLVIVAGPDEFSGQRVDVKRLADGQQTSVSTADGCDELVEWIRKTLAESKPT